MSGFQQVILLGRLVRDPELRSTADGTAVTNATVVTSKEWNDKTTGEKKERVEYHNIVAFKQSAEFLGKYCLKGNMVHIIGKLRTRPWEKDGVKMKSTEVICNEVTNVTPRSAAPAADVSKETFDDDIPF
tara:strand:- start:1066 stop:1455 length:390 start_codon:yes stop_codon:yes gene_type:complete